jgi:hypothetical protein
MKALKFFISIAILSSLNAFALPPSIEPGISLSFQMAYGDRVEAIDYRGKMDCILEARDGFEIVLAKDKFTTYTVVESEPGVFSTLTPAGRLTVNPASGEFVLIEMTRVPHGHSRYFFSTTTKGTVDQPNGIYSVKGYSNPKATTSDCEVRFKQILKFKRPGPSN